MSDSYVLTAEARDRVGKGSARAIRRQGKIPAVIYGDSKPPMTVTLPRKDVFMHMQAGGFMTTVGEIDVDGTRHKVLAKDYQLDPVKDVVLHVDFLRISAKTTVTVNIPVHFENEDICPGIKQGGVLNIVRHDVEVNCPADSIPEAFTLDLATAEVGDALKISSITLPKGVEPTITDRDFTIATIAAPGGGVQDDDEAEAEVAPDEVEATEQKAEGEEDKGEE
ncbi:MAG: 50S ribosomal protein L25/general stress protein Ctc [Roseitalea sp.]|jgi:large subunit ribosomal protein L25|uniref:Large ribosomal subunit protein bL25 n=1 Tax=Oceaniradius stylonematis TaxID=2184161 RepID=A0A3A8A6S4_9HYPH|nr:50S ribosomal protein L25/general stress protein Ctc [Oceaniradius stylonematis]MBO6551597.1 50S ribosomal protein L25/general stress protein Ctc [Roseitalea sp.]MBO6952023.1 50S ribosomal protein L25/general stress protein Ctc [Rhizobiaceae bacterium]RNC95575.1 MAG: 50S ribosomal protein L25/general stress protein Ctc [Oricola sp.]MBO6592131.1 50S ribosomal protein L25/general stress protein Ctc [Roseitalea sp.]MBO6598386.1 50S ribosomal protein L25/general stress protein Ctc [Roseitalea s